MNLISFNYLDIKQELNKIIIGEYIKENILYCDWCGGYHKLNKIGAKAIEIKNMINLKQVGFT